MTRPRDLARHQVEWAAGRRVPVEVVPGGGPVLVLAHGAGSSMSHPGLVGLRDALSAAGATVVTFDYPYRAEGEGRRRPPDRMQILEAAHRAVVAWAREEHGEVALGGRSMGGRVSSHLAAAGVPCSGVVLYAYPLHPPGRPDRLRVEHLADVPVPMLFVHGSRDPLSRPDLFDAHVRPLPGVQVVDLEGADHSLRIPGTPQAETDRRIAEATVAWLRSPAG